MLDIHRAAVGALHANVKAPMAEAAMLRLVTHQLAKQPCRVFATVDLMEEFVPLELVQTARGENIEILALARKRLSSVLMRIAERSGQATRGETRVNKYGKTVRPWLWQYNPEGAQAGQEPLPANHEIVIPTCPCCNQPLPVPQPAA